MATPTQTPKERWIAATRVCPDSAHLSETELDALYESIMNSVVEFKCNNCGDIISEFPCDRCGYDDIDMEA